MFLSTFDIFKIGDGPSSSHTMGPMIAAARFLGELRAGPGGAARLEGRGGLSTSILGMRLDLIRARLRRHGQRIGAHRSNEVLFIDTRPQSGIRIAGPARAPAAPPMGYFIARFEAATAPGWRPSSR